MTCRHYRYLLPQEDADELRRADPQPCPVCDALPHRVIRNQVPSGDIAWEWEAREEEHGIVVQE